MYVFEFIIFKFRGRTQIHYFEIFPKNPNSLFGIFIKRSIAVWVFIIVPHSYWKMWNLEKQCGIIIRFLQARLILAVHEHWRSSLGPVRRWEACTLDKLKKYVLHQKSSLKTHTCDLSWTAKASCVGRLCVHLHDETAEVAAQGFCWHLVLGVMPEADLCARTIKRHAITPPAL